MKLGGITPLGGALGDAFRQYGIERQIREREIFSRWSEIVGTTLARHSEPVRLQHGVLMIHVQNAVWRQELSLMRAELSSRINDAIGMELVKEIILR